MVRVIALSIILSGCGSINIPADIDNLGPPTRNPGVIFEVTYDDPAEVHNFCDKVGIVHISPADPRGYVIHGCALYREGWCEIHYQKGVESVRRHELAHCTHGAWHD